MPVKYGSRLKESVHILFFYRYRIDDLASEKMFMLDLSLYVCMEESRPSDCVVDIPILKNLKMPKPLCNWDGGFTVPSESHLLYHWRPRIINNLVLGTACMFILELQTNYKKAVNAIFLHLIPIFVINQILVKGKRLREMRSMFGKLYDSNIKMQQIPKSYL